MEYNQNDMMQLLNAFFRSFPMSPATVISVESIVRQSTDLMKVKMMMVVNYTTMVEAHADVNIKTGQVSSLHLPGFQEDTSDVQPAYPTQSYSSVPVQSSLDRLIAAHRHLG